MVIKMLWRGFDLGPNLDEPLEFQYPQRSKKNWLNSPSFIKSPFTYVFYINISICEYYIRIYIYTIYTKHNMIIYPLVISYSHSYAFR